MLIDFTQPTPYAARLRGVFFPTIPHHTPTPQGWRPKDFISEDAPYGWYSVWDFLARTEPLLFTEVDDVEADYSDVVSKAAALAAAEGLAPLEWPAPWPLAEAGVATVLLFPDAILRDAIPRNP